LTENEGVEVLIGVSSALSHLHANHIVHRDIKPENILYIPSRRGDRASGVVKLIDFGFATDVGRREEEVEVDKQKENKSDIEEEEQITTRLLQDCLGTVGYMSPEMVRREGHSFPTDIWSLGILFFFCQTSQLPFPQSKSKDDEEEEEDRRDVNFEINYDLFRFFNDQSLLLTQQMLEIDPWKRISSQEVLENEWVTERKSAIETQSKPKSTSPTPRSQSPFNSLESIPFNINSSLLFTTATNDQKHQGRVPSPLPILQIS